jgi:hypothetical protein
MQENVQEKKNITERFPKPIHANRPITIMIVNHQSISHQSPSTFHSILLRHLANLHFSQLDTNVRHVTADSPRAQSHAVAVHDSLGLGPPLRPKELFLAHSIARAAG